MGKMILNEIPYNNSNIIVPNPAGATPTVVLNTININGTIYYIGQNPNNT